MKSRCLAFVPLVVLGAFDWSGGMARGATPPTGPTAGSLREPTIRLPLGPSEGEVDRLIFSPDSQTLAVCNGHNVVHFFDPVTAKDRHHPWDAREISRHPADGLAYSPDGATLATCLYDTLVLLDAATRQPLRILRLASLKGPAGETIHPLSYAILTFSPDGRTLAGSGLDGQIVLLDVATGEVRRVMQGPIVPYPRRLPSSKVLGKPAHVTGLAFAPDGKTLAAAARDAVRLWDVAEGRERLIFDVPGRSWAIAFARWKNSRGDCQCRSV